MLFSSRKGRGDKTTSVSRRRRPPQQNNNVACPQKSLLARRHRPRRQTPMLCDNRSHWDKTTMPCGCKGRGHKTTISCGPKNALPRKQQEHEAQNAAVTKQRGRATTTCHWDKTTCVTAAKFPRSIEPQHCTASKAPATEQKSRAAPKDCSNKQQCHMGSQGRGNKPQCRTAPKRPWQQSNNATWPCRPWRCRATTTGTATNKGCLAPKRRGDRIAMLCGPRRHANKPTMWQNPMKCGWQSNDVVRPQKT